MLSTVKGRPSANGDKAQEVQNSNERFHERRSFKEVPSLGRSRDKVNAAWCTS
ncbi:hypothetical protein AN958_10090 [Leucoagaricus sp. SymC.cos]|nr:hypothetical protein AN958_10090 [Leucoagaricus sp. SymC.cos]